ncbi:MAG: flagellar motor switch phosphatase FliY [Spirochaetia bacterium]|jgi:flagellar motor switch protein FliN/FliY|nr:flagellar motor switch phosphatase FliY [Spirochaetia bacterium]
MSDGSLTQDEIDALLQGSSGGDFTGGDIPVAEEAGDSLSDAEKAAFLSVLQGTVPSQASNLSLLVTKTAQIGAPQVAVTAKDAFAASLGGEVVQVNQNFSDGLLGGHSYILPSSLALSISGLMMGQAGVELGEAALSALQEAVSQVSGPVLTGLGDTLKTTVMADPAEARLVGKNDITLPDDDFVTVSYPVAIEGEAPGVLTEIYSLSQAKEIAAKKSGGAPARPAAAGPQPSGMPGMQPGMQMPGMQMPGMQMQMPGMQMPGMQMPGMQMPPQGYMQNPGMAYGGAAPNVQPIQFPNLNTGSVPMEMHGNITLLMDVYMEMTVELGRTKKLIKEILGMGEGTIIELDKLAGEPVDILVNHKLIAKGEVVVIDENFGVRVTEIVSPMERMSDLT